MPEITTIEKLGHIRHIINVQPGEYIELCRCQQSKEYLFCDGSHKTLPSSVAPAIIDVFAGSEE